MPAPATTYEELKETIAAAYPRLSPQLQRLSRFALEKPHDLALGTVAAVAQANEVQPSSMIRFANALGFDGFSQMQQVFQSHLVERSAPYRERIRQMRSGGEDGDAGVLPRFVGEAIGELQQLEEHVDSARLAAAAKILAAAPQIHVLAQRRAFPVACYLSYALSQLELKAYLLDGMGGMLNESLRNMADDDVLIVTSFHSYSQDVIDAATAAHERGIKVIAITDSALSPLKPSSEVCFELGLASDRAFRSLVAPLCLAQALVVTAGHRLAEDSKPKAAVKKSAKKSAKATKPNGAGA